MKSKIVKLKDAPIGLFITKHKTLCVKTEYGNDESYIVWSGERFWGGAKTKSESGECLVLPISDKVVQRLERKYGRKYKRCDLDQECLPIAINTKGTEELEKALLELKDKGKIIMQIGEENGNS